MKNKDIRKIQFGGWSKRPFREIRNKVSVMEKDEFMSELEDRPEPYRTHKRKKTCKYNKGEHVFQKHEPDFESRVYCKEICINCGKQRWY